MEFETPQHYSEYLKNRYCEPYGDGRVGDSRFAEITRLQYQRLGWELSTNPTAGIESSIANTYSEIVDALPTEHKRLVKSSVAVGVLENARLRAFIAKSPDGKYAILISSGLAIFLHKYLKLTSGIVEPTSIAYCNRKSASALTRDDLRNYRDDLIRIRRADLADIRGPIVKLTDKAAGIQGLLLRNAEMFMMCHELGHFLNGDLEESSGYSALPPGTSGQQYIENRDHKKELRADKTGYGIYSRALDVSQQKIGQRPLPDVLKLTSVMTVFDVFKEVGIGESSTHPDPHERIIRLVDEYFGTEAAVRIAEALKNTEVLKEVLPIPDQL